MHVWPKLRAHKHHFTAGSISSKNKLKSDFVVIGMKQTYVNHGQEFLPGKDSDGSGPRNLAQAATADADGNNSNNNNNNNSGTQATINIPARGLLNWQSQIRNQRRKKQPMIAAAVARQRVHLTKLSRRLMELKQQLTQSLRRFSWDAFMDNEALMTRYTGFCEAPLLSALYRSFLTAELRELYEGLGPRGLTFKDALALTLVKLRQNFAFYHVAYLFGTSTSTANRAFHAMIACISAYFSHDVVNPLTNGKLNIDYINTDKLAYFTNYSNLAIIIDCTEFEIETPDDMYMQGLTYSNYKKRNTAKVLVARSVTGEVVYVSKVYGGHISDKQVVENCVDLWDALVEYNPKYKAEKKFIGVMMDKGFNTHDFLTSKGIEMVQPPFAAKDSIMSDRSLEKTREIGGGRIIIEHTMRTAKKMLILRHRVPVTTVANFDDIVRTVFFLSNYFSYRSGKRPGMTRTT